MKIEAYSKEQLIEYASDYTVFNSLAKLPPPAIVIELPSDNDIELHISEEIAPWFDKNTFKQGAKWLRDLILKQVGK